MDEVWRLGYRPALAPSERPSSAARALPAKVGTMTKSSCPPGMTLDCGAIQTWSFAIRKRSSNESDHFPSRCVILTQLENGPKESWRRPLREAYSGSALACRGGGSGVVRDVDSGAIARSTGPGLRRRRQSACRRGRHERP